MSEVNFTEKSTYAKVSKSKMLTLALQINWALVPYLAHYLVKTKNEYYYLLIETEKWPANCRFYEWCHGLKLNRAHFRQNDVD